MKTIHITMAMAVAVAAATAFAQEPTPGYNYHIPAKVMTPDSEGQELVYHPAHVWPAGALDQQDLAAERN